MNAHAPGWRRGLAALVARKVTVVAAQGQALSVATQVIADDTLVAGLGSTPYRLQVVDESVKDDRGFIFENTRAGIETVERLNDLANSAGRQGRVTSAVFKPEQAEADIDISDRGQLEQLVRDIAATSFEVPLRATFTAPELVLLDPAAPEVVRALADVADEPSVQKVVRQRNETTATVADPTQLPVAASRLVAARLPDDEALQVWTADVTRSARGNRANLVSRAQTAAVPGNPDASIGVDDEGISLFIRSLDEGAWEETMRGLRQAGWDGEMPIDGGARGDADEFAVQFRSSAAGHAKDVETGGQEGQRAELIRRFIATWDRTAG